MIFCETGDRALELLADQRFIADWRALERLCPWATPFQSPAFCLPWYRSYGAIYRPVLIGARDNAGQLTGLLPLGAQQSQPTVVVAGGRQSDYQTWLATVETGGAFIAQALPAIASIPGTRRLTFQYLPEGVPLETLRDSRAVGYEEERRPRPLIAVGNADAVAEYLKQKRSRRSTKNYLNRLKRQGPVAIRRLKAPGELEPLFNTLIAFYDTRQGAANDISPFWQDTRKRAFYLELLESPELLHMTVLTAGGETISGLVGFADGQTFSLAMPMFSPFHADSSPVMLHLLMLIELLHQEGFRWLDLTPGDDAFKERFATDHDTVAKVGLYFKPSEVRLVRAKRNAEALAKRGLRAVGVSPQALGSRLADIRRRGPMALAGSLVQKASGLTNRLRSRLETRVYSMSREAALSLPAESRMHKDDLSSLLEFRADSGWRSRQLFLSESLKKIEKGEHVYTLVADGMLAHYGWLIEEQRTNRFPEVGLECAFPAGTAVLYDFFSHPAARGKGYYQSSLRQMARDAANLPGTQRILISVMADNGPSRHVIEKVGFQYIGSLFLEQKLGRVRRWSTLELDKV